MVILRNIAAVVISAFLLCVQGNGGILWAQDAAQAIPPKKKATDTDKKATDNAKPGKKSAPTKSDEAAPGKPAVVEEKNIRNPPNPPGPAQVSPTDATLPRPEILLMLVRASLASLNDANRTGDYSVLRQICSPGLQAKNTVEQLAASFESIRKLQVDLSPVLILTPQVTDAPTINPQGVLTIKGFFPTHPLQTTFGLAFEMVNGKWRLGAISVSMVPQNLNAASVVKEKNK